MENESSNIGTRSPLCSLLLSGEEEEEGGVY